MKRQRIYLVGAAWLMLVLLIGCVPTTNEPAADAVSIPEDNVAGDEATAVPIIEEIEMSTDENETQPTRPRLEITPETEKPAIQITPAPLPGAGAAGAAAPKPVIPMPADPTAQEKIGKAQDDLGQRLGIDAAQIELVNYQTVTWRDGSMGCPKPGMAYTQALVDGYQIQLQVNGAQYDYHGAAGRDPFYCQNPATGTDTEPAPIAPELDKT